jgi:hypothetical protein
VSVEIAPLATFDNDAKSCYDRIVMVFALMLCQKHGVPQSVCMMAAFSLLLAEYSIKTKHGVSVGTCSSTNDNPTHGPGQGSRKAPALWLIICCLLFEAMSKLCKGAEFCNPGQTSSHQRIGDGFVDDVTTFFNFGLAPMLQRNVGPGELPQRPAPRSTDLGAPSLLDGGSTRTSKMSLLSHDFRLQT